MRTGILVSLAVHAAGLAALVLLHWTPAAAEKPQPPILAFREPEALPPEPAPKEPALPVVEAVAERWVVPDDPAEPDLPAPEDSTPVTGALRLPAPVRLAVALRRARAPEPEPGVAMRAAAAAPEVPLPPRTESRLEPPRLLERDPGASIRYPDRARRLGLTGTVVLRLEVAADGAVAGVAVDTSSGHAALDRAAADAVARWRFAPARRDGVPVAHEIRVPVSFGLTDA